MKKITGRSKQISNSPRPCYRRQYTMHGPLTQKKRRSPARTSGTWCDRAVQINSDVCVNFDMHYVRPSHFVSHTVDKPWPHACPPILSSAREMVACLVARATYSRASLFLFAGEGYFSSYTGDYNHGSTSSIGNSAGADGGD